jgi:hypothetical protein
MIEQQDKLIQQENVILTKPIERKETIVFGNSQPVAKNIISKLKDLD